MKPPANSSKARINRHVLGVVLAATILPLAAAQTATVSPTGLTFLTQVIGTTSAPKTATLTNTGTVSLSITSITTGGDFAQTNNCGSSLAGGAKCTINVTFTPTVIGSRTGTLSVNDNASTSPQTVSLSGSGTIVSLSPTALSFGSVAVGGSAVQTVTLTNASSTATLKITGVSFSGTNASDFSQTNTCGSSVSPSASCSITVTFKPAASGSRRASLNVSDNGGASPQSVSLTGTGTAATLLSIAVTPANPSVAAGQTQQFTATGTYSDGSTQNLTTTATWTSSNTAVATVSNASGTQGLATSLTQGTATITATSGSISGSTTLTVGPAVLVSIAVTPANPSIALGTTQQFTATGTYSDGSTQNLTSTATWTSSNTAVATINTTGLATSVGGGTSTITASSGSITGSTSLTISTAPVLTSITLAPGNPSVVVGATLQLTATGNYSDGSTQNLTNSVTWTSSSPTVATIQSAGQQSPGLLNAVSTGSTSVTATSGSISGSTQVNVQSSGSQLIITIAGGGPTGAPATSADTNFPYAVAVDSNKNFYVAVPVQNRVYKVSSSGTLSLVAGDGFPGYTGDFGLAVEANLNYPTGLAVDSSGNLYIADFGNLRVRKVDTSGTITTAAGDGECFDGDGTATTHGLCYPWSVAVDSSGNLYIADTYDLRVRKVDTNGNMTTVAGTGVSGFSGDGGPATNATLTYPYGVVVDGAGNVDIADQANYVIRQVNTSGIITTIAGTPGTSGYSGDGGPATSATLSTVYGVGADSVGDLFIADYSNQRVREVSGGTINAIAGNGNATFDGDGPATSHALNFPYGLTIDSGGNVYIADTDNLRVREVSFGAMSTVAGNGTFVFIGTGIPAIDIALSFPFNAAPDSSGNIYIADQANHMIRKVDASGNITTLAGTGTCGYSGDGGPAISAQLCNPSRVAVSSSGLIVIADTNNHRIRQVDLSGNISTVAGMGTCGFNGDGAATQHQLCFPFGVTTDTAGNVYIADEINYRIRKVDATGNMTTIAGNGTCGYSGDGGSATSAELCDPTGVAADSAGNVYIADKDNQRIRKVSSGTISTVAGGVGVCSFGGDGGPATKAGLCNPFDVAVDGSGNIYIADSSNQRIREVNTTGTITTVAGDGTPGFQGDGVAPTSTALCYPFGVDVDANGNVYVADTLNQRIRRF